MIEKIDTETPTDNDIMVGIMKDKINEIIDVVNALG